MKQFGDLGHVYKKQKDSIFLEVKKEKVVTVVNELKSIGFDRISSMTGVDNGKEIELLYHFLHDKKIINIKTRLDRKSPKIKSIIDVFPGANIFEREAYEMFGIMFDGNPNMKRLLLDVSSPETPLKKKGESA